jgi:monofunctional biosynthetic peptidoglycan transglycosylase
MLSYDATTPCVTDASARRRDARVTFSVIVFLCLLGSVSAVTNAQSILPPKVQVVFDEKSELDNWIVVNDTVMGGRSRTRLEIKEDTLSFSGTLSLENNGGFASVRRVYDNKNWLTGQPIHIKVMGDGRQYQFRLRTNRRTDGAAYVVNFQSKRDEVTEFDFIEADFEAQFRGRLVQDAPALDFANIEQIGLMLADSNPGEFSLRLVSISQTQLLSAGVTAP